MNQGQLAKLKSFLLEELGLLFTQKQEKELMNKIKSAAKGFEFQNVENFVIWLLEQNLNDKDVEKLASFLTIGETYFFRERKALDFLEKKYLPNIISNARKTEKKLRIWSAGCSSGEEPYTLAIILNRLLPDLENWDIKIIGTDINYKFLQKAKEGIYSKWSFRGVPDELTNKYFDEIDKGKFQIKSFIKDMVQFSFLNLATFPYYHKTNDNQYFDVILCRNVLIYFSKEGIKSVTQNFYKTLNNKGILLLSAVDSSHFVFEDYSKIPYGGIIVYQKNLNRDNKIINSAKTQKSFLKEKKHNKKPKPTIDFKNLAEKFKEKTLSFEKEKQTSNKTIGTSLNPNDNTSEFFLTEAKNKANINLWAEAEKLCLEGLQNDRTNADLHFLLANIYVEEQKSEEAIKSLNRLLFLEPHFAMAHFLKGNIYVSSKKHSIAIKHYKNALNCLSKLDHDEIVEGSDGMTAGGLKNIIKSMKILNDNKVTN